MSIVGEGVQEDVCSTNPSDVLQGMHRCTIDRSNTLPCLESIFKISAMRTAKIHFFLDEDFVFPYGGAAESDLRKVCTLCQHYPCGIQASTFCLPAELKITSVQLRIRSVRPIGHIPIRMAGLSCVHRHKHHARKKLPGAFFAHAILDFDSSLN